MAISKNRLLSRVFEPGTDDPETRRTLFEIQRPLAEISKFLEGFVRPEVWRPLPLLNDWASNSLNFQQAEFTKNPLGEVILRGVCLSSGGASVDLGVLPVGYRPRVSQAFPITILVAGVPKLDVLTINTAGLLSFDGSLLGAGAKNAILFARFQV